MDHNEQNRIQTLHGLRGMAALLVLFSHYSFFKRTTVYFSDAGVEQGQNALIWIGGMGVSCFIILSGFLAYVKYSNRENLGSLKEIRRRIVERYKRFFPLHFLTAILAFPLLFNLYLSKPVNTGIKVVFNVLMLHTWIPHMGVYFSLNAVSWYLGLSVFFVIVTPIMLSIVKRTSMENKKRIYIVFFVIILLQIAVDIVSDALSVHEAIGAGHWLAYICPIVRSLDFVFGGGIGFLYCSASRDNQNKKNTLLFMSALISCCVITFFTNLYKTELFSSFIWTVPCSVMIYCVAISDSYNTVVSKMFNSKVFQLFGEISFELFLWHQLVMRYVLKISGQFLDCDYWWLYFLSFVISVMLAYISHELMMKKAIRGGVIELRRKWWHIG